MLGETVDPAGRPGGRARGRLRALARRRRAWVRDARGDLRQHPGGLSPGARIVVAEACFPTGVLGAWARPSDTGLVAVVSDVAASPAAPDGGPALTGTNPIAIATPSSDGRPVITEVWMGAVTRGDVLTGADRPDELVPFGGPQAHEAFALAAGVEQLLAALAESGHGVVLVARPTTTRARLPGVGVWPTAAGTGRLLEAPRPTSGRPASPRTPTSPCISGSGSVAASASTAARSWLEGRLHGWAERGRPPAPRPGHVSLDRTAPARRGTCGGRRAVQHPGRAAAVRPLDR